MYKQQEANKFHGPLKSSKQSEPILSEQQTMTDHQKSSLPSFKKNLSHHFIVSQKQIFYRKGDDETDKPMLEKITARRTNQFIQYENNEFSQNAMYDNSQLNEQKIDIAHSLKQSKKDSGHNHIGHYNIYHNMDLQNLLKINNSANIFINSNRKIKHIQENYSHLSSSKNREITHARVHSLKKHNDYIINKKNQIKMRVQNQLNNIWMDTLNDVGLQKQQCCKNMKSRSKFDKKQTILRLQNANHNLRYVRKLKPLINTGCMKKEVDDNLNQWKMKICGKGQGKKQKQSKQERKANVLQKKCQQKMKEDLLFEPDMRIQTLIDKRKIIYSQDNQKVIIGEKKIKKKRKEEIYKDQQSKQQKEQQLSQTLNHSNSEFTATNRKLDHKNRMNFDKFKHKNSYMMADNPEQPIVLVPVSTVIYARTQIKKKDKNKTIEKSQKLQQSDPTLQQSIPSKKKQIKSKINAPLMPKNKRKPFSPSFQTYYYRDLIWKVNYSNQTIINFPIQYQHRLKVYIGKGNNSGLIRGLVKRRIWFAITDRIEDANLVWTQLKYLPYFNLQKQYLSIQPEIQSCYQQFSYPENGLLTKQQSAYYKQYFDKNCNVEQRQDERLLYRNKYFTKNKNLKNEIHNISSQSPLIKKQTTSSEMPIINKILKNVSEIKQQKMHNHFINNYIIGNKKTLFKALTAYYKNHSDYVFNYLPYTFNVMNIQDDENYMRFIRFYQQREKQINNNGKDGQLNTKNYWIVKPGENSNRGYGIKLCKTLQQINEIIDKSQFKYQDGTHRTFILQTYIDKPLLYNRRKFDIRHYMMITCTNGILKGYWYQDGYVRTSSTQYSLDTNDSKIHLTNDAVQKFMPQYGKFQKGNKLSYDQLDHYLNRHYGFKNYKFKEIIIPKMKKITTDIIKACSGSIDPEFRGNNFQIFGLDFMIDADFNLWLIEVNTNPCLEISCPLLGSIIPRMIENALQLTLDTSFPPPVRFTPKGVHYYKNLEEINRFDLVYDSRVDGVFRESHDVLDNLLLQEQDETFEDDGEEWSGQD